MAEILKPLTRAVAVAALIGAGTTAREGSRKAMADSTVTPAIAAQTYGMDAYSRNPNNWTIYPFNNNQTFGAHLSENSSGASSIVRLPEGVVGDGYFMVKGHNNTLQFKGDQYPVAAVAEGDQINGQDLTVPYRGVTVWSGENVSPLTVFDQVRTKESKALGQGGQQLGGDILAINFRPYCVSEQDPTALPTTPDQAARLYGRTGTRSAIAADWKITFNQNGVTGAELLQDPSGDTEQVTLPPRTVLAGFVRTADGKTIGEVALGGHMLRPIEPEHLAVEPTNGGTVWNGKDVNPQTVYTKTVNAEAQTASKGGQNLPTSILPINFGEGPAGKAVCPSN